MPAINLISSLADGAFFAEKENDAKRDSLCKLFVCISFLKVAGKVEATT